MHFGVVKWCAALSPAMLPLSDLPLILHNEFLPSNAENGYKYAVWDLANVVPTNVAVVDLDQHFSRERFFHRENRITWKGVQAAIPTHWHWLPGYLASQGLCSTSIETMVLPLHAEQDEQELSDWTDHGHSWIGWLG